MKLKTVWLLLLLAATLLLGGCYTHTAPTSATTETMLSTGTQRDTESSAPLESDTQGITHYQTYPAPQLFSTPVLSGFPPAPMDTGEGFFGISGNTICYYDSIGNRTTLCGQVGCAHNDNTCPAWFANMSAVVMRNGLCYVLTQDNSLNNSAELLRVDLQSGEETVLFQWQAREDSIVRVDISLCTDSFAFCNVTQTNVSGKADAESVDRISLSDGTRKTILTSQSTSELWYRVLGAVQDGLVLEAFRLNAKPLSPEAYWELHPEAAAEEYDEYFLAFQQELTTATLEIINFDGEVTATIADSNTGYIYSPAGNVCWKQSVLYLCNNTLLCYDTATMESTRIAAVGNVVSYSMYDGRAAYVTKDAPGAYGYYFTDIATGQTIELKQRDEDGVLPISVHQETDAAFCGKGDGGTVLISKQDFYNEKYEKAMLIFPQG